jgi:plasmid stability protein
MDDKALDLISTRLPRDVRRWLKARAALDGKSVQAYLRDLLERERAKGRKR